MTAKYTQFRAPFVTLSMFQLKSLSLSLIALLGTALPAIAQDAIFTPGANQPKPSLPPDMIRQIEQKRKTINLSVWEVQHRGQLRPDIDWRMPARYGLDQNKNGTIDLPNSIDYVMNRRSPVNQAGCKSLLEAEFTVNFQSDKTQLPRYQFSRKTAAQINAEKARLEQQGFQVQLDVQRPQVPKISYSWKVEKDGRTYVSRQKNPSFCLPEGEYKVTLSMRQGDQTRKIIKTVRVIDYLIVLLGDSYAAGEGAPEKLVKIPATMRSKNGKIHALSGRPYQANKVSPRQVRLFTQWADHGLKITKRDFGISYGDPKQGGILRIVRQPDPATMWREPKNRMYVENRLSHRSSYTHASQLAMRLERSDSRSSVTFINLAQSGATIKKGVLGVYRGVENDPLLKGGRLMAPQMDQLERLLQQRSADDIFMSIGGNDMGFANIIALLMLSNDDDAKTNSASGPAFSILSGISQAFNSGDWNSIGHPLARGAIADDRGKIHNVTGYLQIQQDYNRLDQRLQKLRRTNKMSGDIHLIVPPFFGSVDRNAPIKFALFGTTAEGLPHTNRPPTLYCRVELKATPIPNFNTINSWEFQWAKANVLNKLYSAMNQAARINNNRWKLVQPGTEPFKHGMCGQHPYAWYRYNPKAAIQGNLLNRPGVRWFRSPEDGAALQAGDLQKNKGMFHPNELGYLYLSRQLEKALGANPIQRRGDRAPQARPWDLAE